MFKRLLPFAVLIPMLGLTGCLVDDEESTDPVPTFRAQYIPAVGLLPFGNDLYIDQESGTLDVPNPMAPVNVLDGFSTTASTVTFTTDSIDTDSVSAGENVVLLNITDPTAPTPLTPGQDYSVSVSDLQGSAQRRIDLHLHQPLATDMPDGEGGLIPARYMVLVTTDIQSTTGNSLEPDTDFRTIRDAAVDDETLDDPQFEAIRQAIQGPLQIADAIGVGSSNVAVLWTFQTQGTRNSLDAVANETTAGSAAVSPSGMDSGDVIDQSPGYAEIYVGFADVPYFLDPEDPLGGSWVDEFGMPLTRANPMPEARAELSVPLFMTVPSAAATSEPTCPAAAGEPAEGWPVVIFQHGITGNRSQMLGVADILSCFGFAMAAIDHPLHGITDPDSPLFVGPGSPFYEQMGVRERHFYMVDGEPSDPAEVIAEEGSFDGSGEHYINIPSLLTSRDNLRQSVADLLRLSASVGNVPIVDATGTPVGMMPVDGDAKFFVGHSLGGIAGTSLTGLDDSIIASVLAMPGGKVTDLLLDSDSFGAPIRAGLEQVNPNLVEGTTLFDNFFRQAQTVIDAGDPANYGGLSTERNVFMIEVADDSVVPNSATDYLADTLSLTQISSTQDSAEAGGRGIVRYLDGNHGSLLQPGGEDPTLVQTWRAIQCHTAYYLASAAQGSPTIDVDGVAPNSPAECQASDIVE